MGKNGISMFMEDNTHVFAKWDKNHQDGTLAGRSVKQKPSGGQGEEFSRKCDEMKSMTF
jgi:hypothetical protein